jgi:hypothetical protein
MNKEQKYIKFRKKSLNEMKELVYQRAELNAHIRKLRKEMESWDRALITE